MGPLRVERVGRSPIGFAATHPSDPPDLSGASVPSAGCFDGGEPPNCPYLASKSKSRKDLKLASLGGLG